MLILIGLVFVYEFICRWGTYSPLLSNCRVERGPWWTCRWVNARSRFTVLKWFRDVPYVLDRYARTNSVLPLYARVRREYSKYTKYRRFRQNFFRRGRARTRVIKDNVHRKCTSSVFWSLRILLYSYPKNRGRRVNFARAPPRRPPKLTINHELFSMEQDPCLMLLSPSSKNHSIFLFRHGSVVVGITARRVDHGQGIRIAST